MKTCRAVLLICLTLVALSCASGQLNFINDLKDIFSDPAVPLHSLTLLHWFANNVNIESDNELSLTFDPRGDFGSHVYYNKEKMLPSVPWGFEYYTIGNLNPGANLNQGVYYYTCSFYRVFPDYVLRPIIRERRSLRRNMDRIIVLAEDDHPEPLVTEIYLTQHYNTDNYDSRYDPSHTFEISTDLLRTLRLFSFDNNRPSLEQLRNTFGPDIDDSELRELTEIWGDQAPLGLLYLIVLPRSRWNQDGVCPSHTRQAMDSAVKYLNETDVGTILTSEWQNSEIPDSVWVTGYTELQLFNENGYACFHLFIEDVCNQWETDFYNSWIGLYKSAEEGPKDYLYWQWQWVINMENDADFPSITKKYCTGTKLAPGLQARFMIDTGYDEKARTPVWR